MDIIFSACMYLNYIHMIKEKTKLFIQSFCHLHHLPESQFLNAVFLQSLSSSLQFVSLLHDWWWLRLGYDPCNLQYTFQNNRCCHRSRQMVVFFSLKQNSHQEMSVSFCAWKIHSNFNWNLGKEPIKCLVLLVKEKLIKNTDPCKSDDACQTLLCKGFRCGSSHSRENHQHVIIGN